MRNRMWVQGRGGAQPGLARRTLEGKKGKGQDKEAQGSPVHGGQIKRQVKTPGRSQGDQHASLGWALAKARGAQRKTRARWVL